MSRFLYYRTKDGRADYGFDFERQGDGSWRVYIQSQPPYMGRDTDAHSTHRYDDNGRKYICWDRPIRSFEDAKRIAATWADRTQKYIRYGRGF